MNLTLKLDLVRNDNAPLDMEPIETIYALGSKLNGLCVVSFNSVMVQSRQNILFRLVEIISFLQTCFTLKESIFYFEAEPIAFSARFKQDQIEIRDINYRGNLLSTLNIEQRDELQKRIDCFIDKNFCADYPRLTNYLLQRRFIPS